MRILRLTAYMLTMLIGCPLFLFGVNTQHAAAQAIYQSTGEIAVCSISQESILRSCAETADLYQLGTDEFYSFVLRFTYNGVQPKDIRNFYVRVNDGPKWAWAISTLNPGDSFAAHIYHANMKKLLTPGAYKVIWYIDDTPILTKSFTFTAPADWFSRFSMPSASEISHANQTAALRSPYLYGWLQMNSNFRYTEYAVDFKADFVPKATYCTLANLRLDLSGMKKKYRNVRSEYESVNLYAGFQRRWDEYITIMSAWDIYYTDKDGVQRTLRPRQLYPEKIYIGDGTFSGEGTGLQMLMPYNWEADHWYRMLLQCGQSDAGTTTVEQWICDLETGAWTLMCKCDTGLPDSCFIGPNAFFLENFDPAYAGEIRTMEVANVRVKEAGKSSWQSIRTASIGSNGGKPHYNGSYAYGADDSCFWLITSGAGGDWFGTNRVPENNRSYTVKSGSAVSPY